MEINWTVLSYFVIGLFVLNGFFRGWWKEAITTVFLVILVFLLQQPGIAESFIEFINGILAAVWGLLPDSLVSLLNDFLENGLGIQTTGGMVQADPGSGGTWLIILLLFMTAAVLLTRFSLPNYQGRGYAVRPAGGLLGGLLGGLNGFIIVNLVREYLDGRNLPGSTTEVAQIGGGSAGMASPGVVAQAVELPSFTILDSFVPWIIIAIGIVVFIMALRSRVGFPKSKTGFRKIEYKQPYGYQKYGG